MNPSSHRSSREDRSQNTSSRKEQQRRQQKYKEEEESSNSDQSDGSTGSSDFSGNHQFSEEGESSSNYSDSEEDGLSDDSPYNNRSQRKAGEVSSRSSVNNEVGRNASSTRAYANAKEKKVQSSYSPESPSSPARSDHAFSSSSSGEESKESSRKGYKQASGKTSGKGQVQQQQSTGRRTQQHLAKKNQRTTSEFDRAVIDGDDDQHKKEHKYVSRSKKGDGTSQKQKKSSDEHHPQKQQSTKKYQQKKVSEFDRALTDVSSAGGVPYQGDTKKPGAQANSAASRFTQDDNEDGNKGARNDGQEEEFLLKANSAVLEEILSNDTPMFDDEMSQTSSIRGKPSSSRVPPGHSKHMHATKAAEMEGRGRKMAPNLYAESPHLPPSPPRPPRPRPPLRTGNAPVEGSHLSMNMPPSNNTVPMTPNGGTSNRANPSSVGRTTIHPNPEDLSSGMLPDVLMSMRQKIESLSLFDSDMMRLAEGSGGEYEDEDERASKESLRRSFHQSISAAVLVSLAHKRYERRRLAAMEIEKVVRSLVQQNEFERVRAILLLLSDDYVRSTSEDARKGGVVALAACEIGLKKADETNANVSACKDLILASVVHACQDHNQRVRYYATESLFNVIKVLPSLAVQHFFILFEILRSLYADVDHDVRSGSQLLDKKLKEIIVAAINNGSFTVDACVPLFSRFVYMRNKPTKRLTLTWLQEFSEKLVGSPILEFLHLFLGGVFAMVADPNSSIRQLALGFLQTILPKLLVNNEDFEDASASPPVDFDKILQSLVTTMEHPDPFVRKVAMYWMSQIVQAHIGESDTAEAEKKKDTDGVEMGLEDVEPSELDISTDTAEGAQITGSKPSQHLSAASVSVRNALPHVLPGILLSIGDAYHTRSTTRDAYFFAAQTTHSLAEQTNMCLQNVVRRDGKAFVSHLDGFIVTLLEELDTPGGLGARSTPAVERKPYRMDVKSDGSGIESTGWFRSSEGTEEQERNNAMMISRLCALQWITVLYENVVPDSLKAEYAREFISPIIHQLVFNPPDIIIFKSFEVLATITVPVEGEVPSKLPETSTNESPNAASLMHSSAKTREISFPPIIHDTDVPFDLDTLDTSRRQFKSRDREVFAELVNLHSHHHRLLTDLSRVIEFMCTLQPPEFVFVSFALELDKFVVRTESASGSATDDGMMLKRKQSPSARDLEFVSSFVQRMNVALLTAKETAALRNELKDCIGPQGQDRDERKLHLFHVLLHSFAHNFVAALSLCLWGGAYLTASVFLHQIDPLDINLVCYLEIDQLIELLERPLFRHLHLRMLESDHDTNDEGSGAMLFRTLKSLLMLLPQSTSYNVLRDRLLTCAKFRQNSIYGNGRSKKGIKGTITEVFVSRVKEVRSMHCNAKWNTLRAESLELAILVDNGVKTPNQGQNSEKHQREKEVCVGKVNEDVLLRHPDEVLPKDQTSNFQALKRSGLLHQAQNRNISVDYQASGIGRNSVSESSKESGEKALNEKAKWKEYWLRPGAEQ